uniref:Uncharacterized protein n=1 Tax=Meloidogyne incognita TaxID=6306 RepID=A0A914LPV8_MELIC
MITLLSCSKTTLMCKFFNRITHRTIFFSTIFPMRNYLTGRSTMFKCTLTSKCAFNHVFQNTFHYSTIRKFTTAKKLRDLVVVLLDPHQLGYLLHLKAFTEPSKKEVYRWLIRCCTYIGTGALPKPLHSNQLNPFFITLIRTIQIYYASMTCLKKQT